MARFPIRWRCGSRARARRGTFAATDDRCLRASAGIYFARQNMLSQVGSVTTNGVQQQSIFVSTDNVRQFGATPPTWPGVLTPTPVPEGQFPLFTGVRVFHRDYENPRTTTANVGYEQEVVADVAAYADYHLRARPAPDAVHQLQPRRRGQSVQPAARRNDGDHELRASRTITA